MKLKRIAIDAVMLALLAISAKISIKVPFTEIAFTLQVLVVCILSFMLPLKDGILVIVTYLIMGILGLPVFSVSSGASIVLMPTFGFIIGFIFMPFVIKIFNKTLIKNQFVKNLIGGVISIIVLYIFGMIHFYFIKNVYVSGNYFSISKIFMLCVLPFIPIDLIKIILADVIALRLNKILKLYN